MTASRILGRVVTPDDKVGRGTGKIADLALGYGGSLGAWRRFAPDSDESDAEIGAHVTKWRSQHRAIVRFWYALENAVKRSVRTGERVKLGNLAAECIDNTLFITLPSGRKLAYPEAHLGPGKFNSTQVHFKDNAKAAWKEIRGWYGTWVENVVQAISRDLLAAAMQRLEAAGYPVVLHCHDEAVAEVPEGFGSADEFLRLMLALPDWAKGLPIAAKVWGPRQRYGKSELAPTQNRSPEIATRFATRVAGRVASRITTGIARKHRPCPREPLNWAGAEGRREPVRTSANARPDHRADRRRQGHLSVPRRSHAVLPHLRGSLSLLLLRRARLPDRLADAGRRSRLRGGR